VASIKTKTVHPLRAERIRPTGRLSSDEYLSPQSVDNHTPLDLIPAPGGRPRPGAAGAPMGVPAVLMTPDTEAGKQRLAAQRR
jgi:hypothetical protein